MIELSEQQIIDQIAERLAGIHPSLSCLVADSRTAKGPPARSDPFGVSGLSP
jgi:hypothetical protein